MSRILIVDDRVDIRMSLEAMLEDAGHDILAVENGKEALEVLEKEMLSSPFNLVITDIMMPELDGIELMTAINVGMGDNKPKVLAISGGGYSMVADDLLAAASEMADHVLRKPFTNQELMAAIDTALNGSK